MWKVNVVNCKFVLISWLLVMCQKWITVHCHHRKHIFCTATTLTSPESPQLTFALESEDDFMLAYTGGLEGDVIDPFTLLLVVDHWQITVHLDCTGCVFWRIHYINIHTHTWQTECWGESTVIMADKKFTLFHQYLRYCHKCCTIAFSTPGAILWV